MEKYMERECTVQSQLVAPPLCSGGGQKMPSLKADCLTLMSILVNPQVKRHTSSFDQAFLCTGAPDMSLHTHMWPAGP